MNKNTFLRAVATLMIGIVGLVAVATGFNQSAPAQAQYSIPCYGEQGGTKRVAGSGCEYEFQAGSVVDIQAGATVSLGQVLGQNAVLQYPTPNTMLNCKTNTITDTASYTATVTAISTPQFALCNLDSISGDAAHCAAAVGSGIVTITVRNSAATPAANAAGAVVNWCAGGTPQ